MITNIQLDTLAHEGWLEVARLPMHLTYEDARKQFIADEKACLYMANFEHQIITVGSHYSLLVKIKEIASKHLQ